MFNVNLSPISSNRLVDPSEIFDGLTLRGAVKNIWNTQTEALHGWHKVRTSEDVVIEMNTGGGKTLVGLVIAKSLANELQRGVVYACPNNQLAAQVVAQADGLSLPTATYTSAEKWGRKEVFASAEGPCVTSYASVFNGQSTFRNEDVAAVLLDDAHVASSVLRSQFTVSLPLTKHDPDRPSLARAGLSVVNLFADEIAKGQGANTLKDIVKRGERGALFVPSFAVREREADLNQILLSNGVADQTKTLFAWSHIKDHLESCAILIGARGVEITPPVLPTWSADVYADAERRVYLTATVPSDAEIVQTFGMSNPRRVCPGGRSGEAQRLFVFPSGNDDEQRATVQTAIGPRKTLAIVPSNQAALRWNEAYDRDANHAAEIASFAATKDPETLVLAARYDGIDLPGDTCNLLVLDGLPRGESLLDSFVEDTLRARTLREQRTAVRITQALGRIFRSNTDHGAVLVVGRQLQDWLSAPARRRLLPNLIQKQVRLGQDFSKELDPGAVGEAVDRVVAGDPAWDAMYRNYLSQVNLDDAPGDPAWLVAACKHERLAYRLLWEGEPTKAAEAYARAYAEAEGKDRPLGAWYLHWGALSTLAAGDREAAAAMYRKAANTRSALGRLATASGDTSTAEPGVQARAVAATLRATKPSTLSQTLDRVDAGLVYGEEHTARAEEAVRTLGELLGFQATRPDKTEGRGPDVLWLAQPNAGIEPSGAWFELKTGKGEDAVYKKNDDIGQALNHYGYVAELHPDRSFLPRLLGRLLPVVSEANPPEDLAVTPLEGVQDLAARVRTLYEGLGLELRTKGEDGLGGSLDRRVQAWLERDGLTWPSCVEALDTRLAVDLPRP